MTIYHFVFNQGSDNFFDSMVLVAINHFIHFVFLANNVFLNNIELVPIKLLGGFLAYLLTLFFPFVIKAKSVKPKFYYIYFYYVGAVFLITYIARIRGDFEGAEPSWMHYAGYVTIFIALIILLFVKLINPKQ